MMLPMAILPLGVLKIFQKMNAKNCYFKRFAETKLGASWSAA